MHNAASDTQSSLDSGCRFAADPLREFGAVASPLRSQCILWFALLGSGVGRDRDCDAQHNQVSIKPREGLDIGLKE